MYVQKAMFDYTVDAHRTQALIFLTSHNLMTPKMLLICLITPQRIAPRVKKQYETMGFCRHDEYEQQTVRQSPQTKHHAHANHQAQFIASGLDDSSTSC